MQFKPILFIVFAIVSCSQSVAQELSSIEIYDRETLYIHYSIFGDGFVKNGKIISIGAFGSSLTKEMAGSEYALEEMRKARKYKIASTITTLVATTFQLTGIVMAFRDDKDSISFEIASIAVGGICGMLAEGFSRKALAAMNRAVWLYNRDVMSGQLQVWKR